MQLIIHKVALFYVAQMPLCTASTCQLHIELGMSLMQKKDINILKNIHQKEAVEQAVHLNCHVLVAIFSFFLKVGKRWRNVPSRQESHMSPCSSDCWSLMSMADGESFQSKLLKTSGQAFSLMQLKCPSRWCWHGNL